MIGRIYKAATEASGLIQGPQRVPYLFYKVAHDSVRSRFALRHLYSYTITRRQTDEALAGLISWMLRAQRADGGIAAYYSLLTGYSESYPEVTGYIIPTLYDFSRTHHREDARKAAERATEWLLSIQLKSGAFAGGLHGEDNGPSVFNTGQILQGLVRGWKETGTSRIRDAALAAGDWLLNVQQADGSWAGEAAYQGGAHTYYSMVAWALAQLEEQSGEERYGLAAERNMDWVLSHLRPNGWIDGINLQGHPNYLHFVAYIIQGVLECALLRHRNDAVEAIKNPAWTLLRKFEKKKDLPGAFEHDFTTGHGFTCLTGNAQMSCVWLRLSEVTRDLRYLNSALKMNELLKERLPERGASGVRGGVSGSYPIWGAYQPFRYISWGCKFLADALSMEEHATQQIEAECAS